MNLDKLFQMQKALDERITKEKGLEGQDLLPQKILALQVELGELANEWRGFKFWSNKRLPRLIAEREKLGVFSLTFIEQYNPLKEEYVDCLHFILSIGNDLGFNEVDIDERKDIEIGESFKFVYRCISNFEALNSRRKYDNLFNEFIHLGKYLGFSWEQIEQAYLDKNAINHTRQSEGY